MNRRNFLIAGGAAGAFPFFKAQAAPPPSKCITMGFIGYGGRSSQLLPIFLHNESTRVLAVCDVVADRRAAAQSAVHQHYGNQDCQAYRDFREMLARPDIDALYIATGDRWHAQLSIQAMQAGKDVYCEKPISISMAESAAVVAAAQRYHRIYQGGVQRRGIGNFKIAMQAALSGKLGKIHTVHAGMVPMGRSARNNYLAPEPQPEIDKLDWNMWLGPAPWRDYNKKYLHSWHTEYDFHGDLTEWGSHTVDLCQLAVRREMTAPVRYVPEGRTLTAFYDDGLKLVMRDHGFKNSCAVRFEGDEGWIETDDSGQICTSHPNLIEQRKIKGEDWKKPLGHTAQFIDCVKSRRTPDAPPDSLHFSHLCCHAATIACHLNRELEFDPVKACFTKDAEANRLRNREHRAPWYL